MYVEYLRLVTFNLYVKEFYYHFHVKSISERTTGKVTKN